MGTNVLERVCATMELLSGQNQCAATYLPMRVTWTSDFEVKDTHYPVQDNTEITIHKLSWMIIVNSQ
jgi:hypothetical protein